MSDEVKNWNTVQIGKDVYVLGGTDRRGHSVFIALSKKDIDEISAGMAEPGKFDGIDSAEWGAKDARVFATTGGLK